jgi:multidrug transporter EmrE-like cation transporter
MSPEHVGLESGVSGNGMTVTGLSTSAVLGLACAVLSALGTNLAFLYKHRGAVAAPDVDMREPFRSAIDLFRSKWWTIGWLVAAAAFLAHVGALALLPLSLAQAVLSGGFVLLAVLAERFFGFELRRRQWVGIVLVAASLALLAVTDQGSGGDDSDYSVIALIVFEGGAVALGMLLIFSRRVQRVRGQYGVILGAAAGLGFGISDVAIKALTGDLESGIGGLLSPWTVLIITAAVASFFASARSLQIGEGVAVIAVTSVAANMSTILAGVVVFGDPLGDDFLVVAGRIAAFLLVLVAAALMPAPVRAGEALREPRAERRGPAPSPA